MNHPPRRRPLLIIAAGLILFCSPMLQAAEALQAGAPAAGYHDYEALTQALQKLAAANPGIAKLVSIGKTLQGRDLWLLQVSGRGDPLSKQALLIAANLEGDHLVGSEVALGIAENLVGGYGRVERVTSLLDKRTFYIVPRLNPDGAESFFGSVRLEHDGNLDPRDDDYDWKTDEDGPEDLNGDGKITLMRVKDKDGGWIVDDKDLRLMKKKAPGTSLDKLYKIFPEGLDDDGDGFYNEDGPGGFDINRNFPHNFGYKPLGLKVYPASEAETRALLDFMDRYSEEFKTQPHKNICGVLIFSKFDNLAAGTGIECGTASFPEPPGGAQVSEMMRFGRGMMFMMGGRRGSPQVEPQERPVDPQPRKTESRDEPLFKAVGEQYKKTTGIESAHSEKPAGSLLEYAYFEFGVPAFSANLWSVREDRPAGPGGRLASRGSFPADSPPGQGGPPAGGPPQSQATDRAAMMQRFISMRGGEAAETADGSETDAKWLKWIDEKNGGKGFIAWTPFQHRQLGQVEIGGFEPYLRTNPPAGQIPELVKTHSEFACDLASRFAEIVLDPPKVEKLADHLFRISVRVRNTGGFPYATAMGERARSVNPILIRIRFEDDKKMDLFGGLKRVDIPSLESLGEKETSWTILSPPGKSVEIVLWARQGGGTLRKTVVLK